MNIHLALYKWKSSATPEKIQGALEIIESLADKISGIVEICCAENSSRYNEGYSHVILVRGKSQAAIDAYRSHPDHTRAAELIEAIELHGIGVDFETK